MSVLVVGVSHKTAPVALLESLALDVDGVHKLVTDVASSDHVSEAAVIATCNRLEIYASVDRFHGSVEELSTLLDLGLQRPQLLEGGAGLLDHLGQGPGVVDDLLRLDGRRAGEDEGGSRRGEGNAGSHRNLLWSWKGSRHSA